MGDGWKWQITWVAGASSVGVLWLFACLVHFCKASGTDGTALQAPRILSQFVVDGLTAFDAGALETPPVNSSAQCCRPLAYDTPATQLWFLAGLQYRLHVHSQAGSLGANVSAVRLRLVFGSVARDAECNRSFVSDFAGAHSDLAGHPAQLATAFENRWDSVRFPRGGSFKLCYAEDASAPAWRVLGGVNFTVFGASETSGRFRCAAEAGAPCDVDVGPPEPASRLALVELGAACGSAAPLLRLFEQAAPAAAPTPGSQRLGSYAASPPRAAAYRLCLCGGFAYNASAGACRSADARDFTQAVGTLELAAVSTAPEVLYSEVPFELRVHCGASGCAWTPAARIRLIDLPPTGQWGGAGAGDLCRDAEQSELHRAPENCGDVLDCRMEPSANGTLQPTWTGLVVRAPVFYHVVTPTVVGICFCSGTAGCSAGEHWFRVGTLVVSPLRILPDVSRVGVATDLHLFGPGGGWSSEDRAALKIAYDPDGHFNSTTCGSMPHVPGTTWNHMCPSPLECPPQDLTSSEGHTWRKIEFRRVGTYIVCFCSADCGGPQNWNYVGQHLAAGPRHFYAGIPSQGRTVSAGSRFDLVVIGEGLSIGDRLAFLRGDHTCDALAYGRADSADFGPSRAPHSLISDTGGGLAILPLADGTGMVTGTPHGLQLGQSIRFENVTTLPGAAACPGHHVIAWSRQMSHCAEALMANSVNVTAVPSETEVVLGLALSPEESAGLDLSGARWRVTSHETFSAFLAPWGSHGQYTVCWGQDASKSSDYAARAGTLDVVEPITFRSALHLTSVAPGFEAPSILAFELGNQHAYSAAVGPMSLRVGFRNVSQFRHAFRPADLRMSPSVPWTKASQSVCGQLFQELWSEGEDGFPHPRGCFYDEELAEYGLVFPPGAGLQAGMRYQIVSRTELLATLVREHEWLVVSFAVPEPAFSPAEIRHTAPHTGGDVGEVVNEAACKELCAASPRCNVAVYHVSGDRRCLIADFSERQDPYATASSRAAGRADLTMFLVDRLNRTSPLLEYRGAVPSSAGAVLDLWSHDDMELRPFAVLEASAAAAGEVAGLAPAPLDPRWHRPEGLRVLGAEGAAEGAAARLAAGAGLALRLRAARGARIEAGAVLRLFLRPLTQWALGKGECRARCQSPGGAGCGRVACRPEALVTSPWLAGRNSLRLELPAGMDAITESAARTLRLSGRHLALPSGGFLPARLAAELRAARDADSLQPHADYVVSTGALVYAPVTVAGALFAQAGNSRPFAGDAGNVLVARLRLGSVVHAGPRGLAHLVLRLPVGYTCQAAHVTSGDPRALAAAVADNGLQDPGELRAAGQWSFDGNDCLYHLSPNTAIYGGSSILVLLTVSNPAMPMTAEDATNRWSVTLTAPGDGPEPVALGAYELAGDARDPLLPKNVAVLGRLSHTSLVPTSFWWAAPQSMARVFFSKSQASGDQPSRISLQAPPGFSFHRSCRVQDLPWQHYRPYQSPLSHGMAPVVPLGASRSCRASARDATKSPPLGVAEIALGSPLVVGAVYGFAIQVLHSLSYRPSEASAFALSTFTQSGKQPVDKAPAMPLLPATQDDAWPSYGLYMVRGEASMLQVVISNLLPFAYISKPAVVVLLLQPPLDSNSTDDRVRAYSSEVSWRILAPDTYEWDFSQAEFFYRRAEVEHGVTADLPISRVPLAPQVPPFNRINFWGQDEHPSGWQPGRLYGFRTFVRVPAETPRQSVNEWIGEWGFDRPRLAERACAVSVDAGEVRTLHSARVQSLGGGVRGGSDELLFQLGLVTPVPAGGGALVLEAPPGFAFEAACVPFAPRVPYAPYLPVPARLDCASSEAASTVLGGALRPVITLRPLDVDIPAGMWSFVLACVNPSDPPIGSVGSFLMYSYTSYTDETNIDTMNVVADVGAAVSSFEVREEMPFADIINPANYALSGRNDHPGQSSLVVIAFELRTPPAIVGNHELEVLAPEGFDFSDGCHVDIGQEVFGPGQAFPSPCVPFEGGVRVLSCAGYGHRARAVVTPGLRAGRRYAFRIRVDRQPALTPARNEWRLAFGAEASAPMKGYRLWAFEDMALTMSRLSRVDEAAPVDNTVDLAFNPTNSVPLRGMLAVTAPQGYKIHFRCTAEIAMVHRGGAAAPAQGGPEVTCKGEQPPANRAQIRFQSGRAFVSPDVRHRLTLTVTNPSFLAPYAGFWMLQSFSVASDDPEPALLLDVGRIPSLAITELFPLFAVGVSGSVGDAALRLPLEFDVLLPRPLAAGDVLDVLGPAGYDFAAPVADASLREGLRRCARFEDLSAPPAPPPLCAGGLLRLRPPDGPGAGARLRFRAASGWPRRSLAAAESAFRASLAGAGSPGMAEATALALLAPITPRLLGFDLARIGPRADAVSTRGSIRISFNASQSAEIVSITTQVDSATPSQGADFGRTAVEVHAAQQLLKEAAVVRNGPYQLLLVFQIATDTGYVLFLRDVANPDVISPVRWTLQTYAFPQSDASPSERPNGTLGIAPGEVLLALRPENKRDEMVRWLAMHTVGRIQVDEDHAVVENSFFDFPDTRVSFMISVRPIGGTAGQRLLIFAPSGWQLVPNSFAGEAAFPLHQDIGPLTCFDAVSGHHALLYAVRLLADIRSLVPCRLNIQKDCVNEVHFSLRVGTPATPIDLKRWRRESDQAWLIQIDAHTGITCGPTSEAVLDPSLVRLTNDALFPGFYLKESIAQMVVVPEPNGLLSRQRTTVAVEFETRSLLEMDAPLAPTQRGLFLRLVAAPGVEFDRGCLAAVPDPDYFSCTGDGPLAVLKVRGTSFAMGKHRMLLRLTNPVRTPSYNRWTLESFVGVTYEDALHGRFENLRQRGQAVGYVIAQSLSASLRPSSTEKASNIVLFLWMRPRVLVESLGYVELHSPSAFEISCEPPVLLISMPPVRCQALAEQPSTTHKYIELQLAEGNFLLPNSEHEMGVHARSPNSRPREPFLTWGLRLRSSTREVLESNMEIEPIKLTDTGLSVASLTPNTISPYARNEVRLVVSFARSTAAMAVSELRILAPAGWDLQPLCSRYWDATGACGVRCEWQLPYSEERGHHHCPQPRSLVLLLDPSRAIRPGEYLLLLGAMNPAAAPSRNLWRVSLRSARRLLAESAARGFAVSRDSGNGRPHLLPLRGEYLEPLSGAAAAAAGPSRAALLGALAAGLLGAARRGAVGRRPR